jgi:hypothetical protein
MRILVWNITMAVHKKIASLQQLIPDLATVLQVEELSDTKNSNRKREGRGIGYAKIYLNGGFAHVSDGGYCYRDRTTTAVTHKQSHHG